MEGGHQLVITMKSKERGLMLFPDVLQLIDGMLETLFQSLCGFGFVCDQMFSFRPQARYFTLRQVQLGSEQRTNKLFHDKTQIGGNFVLKFGYFDFECIDDPLKHLALHFLRVESIGDFLRAVRLLLSLGFLL